MVDAIIVGPDKGEPLGKGSLVGLALGEALGRVDAVTVGPNEGEALGKGPLVGPAVGKALGMVDGDCVSVGDALGNAPPPIMCIAASTSIRPCP